MSQPCDREGNFKAHILDYGIRKADSGAIAVTIKAQLMALWDSEQQDWIPWSEYDQEAWGDIWVVKKDGSLNENAVKSLINHAGWDGTLESIANKTWQPADCQVQIQENKYQGETTYRVSFVNDLERIPGGINSLSQQEVGALAAQYGAPLRALAGTALNAKKSAPKPGSRPAAPPKKPAAKPADVPVDSAGDPLPEDRSGDEIPF